MLILSRRTNESVRIGADVIITVVGFSGNQIRLGITAPPNVVIDREEVHQRKLSERIPTLSAAPPLPAPPVTASPGAAPQTLRTRRIRQRTTVRRRSTFGAE
jgi:carbon storage regulator